jgi:hypothetical protein
MNSAAARIRAAAASFLGMEQPSKPAVSLISNRQAVGRSLVY